MDFLNSYTRGGDMQDLLDTNEDIVSMIVVHQNEESLDVCLTYLEILHHNLIKMANYVDNSYGVYTHIEDVSLNESTLGPKKIVLEKQQELELSREQNRVFRDRQSKVKEEENSIMEMKESTSEEMKKTLHSTVRVKPPKKCSIVSKPPYFFPFQPPQQQPFQQQPFQPPTPQQPFQPNLFPMGDPMVEPVQGNISSLIPNNPYPFYPFTSMLRGFFPTGTTPLQPQGHSMIPRRPIASLKRKTTKVLMKACAECKASHYSGKHCREDMRHSAPPWKS